MQKLASLMCGTLEQHLFCHPKAICAVYSSSVQLGMAHHVYYMYAPLKLHFSYVSNTGP